MCKFAVPFGKVCFGVILQEKGSSLKGKINLYNLTGKIQRSAFADNRFGRG
jgi:hypothetical protein